MKVRLTVAALALVFAWGCAAKPERATLQEFFTQSKLLDKTALKHLSTVVFDPQVDGIVESFEVVSVSKEENGKRTATVSAKVRMPGEGGPVQKTILLTLARGQASGESDARWIVTGFIERSGAPAIPRS